MKSARKIHITKNYLKKKSMRLNKKRKSMNRKSTTRKSMHGGSNNNSMETTVVGDCNRKLDELEEQAREVKSTCQREVDELKEKANGNINAGFNPQKAISL
jgi:hypothetical protein